jgi:hypothetical protein
MSPKTAPPSDTKNPPFQGVNRAPASLGARMIHVEWKPSPATAENLQKAFERWQASQAVGFHEALERIAIKLYCPLD